MSSPDDLNLRKCIRDLKEHNVKMLVAACEKNYDVDLLTNNSIDVVDFVFDDGELPDKILIKKWIEKIDEFFDEKIDKQPTIEEAKSGEDKNARKGKKRIAVHCVAGLGRAPLLVAIALVHKGCKP